MLVLFGAILFLQATPAPVPQSLASVTSTRVIGLNGRTAVEVEIVNTATEVMTAWQIELSFSYGNGKEGARSISRDGYLAAAGLNPRGTVVAPQAKTREVFVIGAPATEAVLNPKAYVAWAIFADGTWAGDTTGIGRAFDQRSREKQAWMTVSEALRLARMEGGRSGLGTARGYLVKTPFAEHRVVVAVRQQIDHLLRQIDDAQAINTFLHDWLTKAEEHTRAASAHEVQRQRRKER